MELTELRKNIDTIDQQLIALFEQRMDVASSIAAYKKAAGKPILDTSREEEKLQAVAAQCRPETADLIAGLFKEIMAASRNYQARHMESDR